MDEENDQQILDGIDEDIFKVNYEVGSFESLNYVLDKVENELNLDYILQEKRRLEKQLNVVSRRLSTSIMEKEGAYGKEMKRVIDIQNKLSEAIGICRSARKGFDKGRSDFTCASLGIVASYRRREGLRDVLKSLSTIKTLQQTNVRLKEMIEEDNDHCAAIQLCIECQKVVNTLKHYKCVSELSSKLTDMLDMIEEHIDASLSKMCHNFNVDTYKGLQKAYSLLGKTQTSMDSLCMHFATAISDKAFSVVHGYVELCSVEAKKIENFRKKEYKELCKYVTNECFIPCLIDLSKSLFNILLNYRRILYFHQCEKDTNDSTVSNNNDENTHHQSEPNNKCHALNTDNDDDEERSVAAATITTTTIANSVCNEDQSDIEDGGGGIDDNGSGDAGDKDYLGEEDRVEANFNRRFILQKLEHGLGRIWQEAQQKLRALVQSHDMSNCSFEELMTILRVSRRMIDIGMEFCDNNSTEFEETLHEKTVNYFNHYHKTRLDELRMYLENESWTVCPVKNGFQYFDLQEFKFLKPLRAHSLGNLSLANSETSGPGSPEKSSFFRDSLLADSSGTIENPFDNICLENEDASDSIIRELERSTNKVVRDGTRETDAAGDDTSEDEIEDEMAMDSSKNSDNDQKVTSYNEGPLVTNTSLYVLRLIGKYMQIMFLLRQIAFDILLSIFHLFDYYFYTVYTFFAKEISDIRNNCLSVRFKTCLVRIEDSMKNGDSESNDDQHPSTIQSMGLMDRTLNPENLYGLSERIVGIESVMFLASQLNVIQQYFRDLIPSSKHSILDKYYMQAVSVAQDLRYPGYMLVAIRSINYESILTTVENVRWDLTEIPSMHNSYVDSLLKEIQLFSSRLDQICSELEAKVPQEAKNMLWSSVLKLANRTFVEGFSMAKKCTPAGRALMQLDYQEFLTKAEKMTLIKPIPERELVEEYIKAYYLMDDALEKWIMSRNEYTQRQLLSLVNCIASEKRVKNRLLAIIDSKFENQNCLNTVEVKH